MEVIITLDITGKQGIPNTLREKLLQTDRAMTALVLDAMYLCGMEAGYVFSVAQLQAILAEHGIKFCQWTLRRAVGNPLIPMIEIKRWTMQGRNPLMFKVLSIQEMLSIENIDFMGVTDKIGVWGLQSVRNYRATLHLQFIKRCPGQYSRRWLGLRLGVSERATCNYEKLFPAGTFVIEEKVEYIPIISEGMIKYLPKVAERGGKWLEIWFMDMTGWTVLERKRVPLCQYLARKFCKMVPESMPMKMWECIRKSNYYSIGVAL